MSLHKTHQLDPFPLMYVAILPGLLNAIDISFHYRPVLNYYLSKAYQIHWK